MPVNYKPWTATDHSFIIGSNLRIHPEKLLRYKQWTQKRIIHSQKTKNPDQPEQTLADLEKKNEKKREISRWMS